MGERGSACMGSRPEPLETGSGSDTRSRPAPGSRDFSRTFRAWPSTTRTLYGGPRRAVEPFAPWGPIRI